MYVMGTNSMIFEDIIKAVESEKRYAEKLLSDCDIVVEQKMKTNQIVQIIVTFIRFGTERSFIIEVDRNCKLYAKDILYKIQENFKSCLCSVLNMSYKNENILERSEESE